MSDASTLGAFAQELLDTSEAALETTAAGGIARRFVSAGAPALDCCPQLTVHVQGLQIENTSPTSPVTAPAHRLTTTGALFLASFIITVVRCVPISEENRQVIRTPSPEALTASALEIDEDLWAIWNALATAYRAGDLFDGRCAAFYLDPPTPQQTEGACGGWQIPVRASIGGYQVAL